MLKVPDTICIAITPNASPPQSHPRATRVRLYKEIPFGYQGGQQC